MGQLTSRASNRNLLYLNFILLLKICCLLKNISTKLAFLPPANFKKFNFSVDLSFLGLQVHLVYFLRLLINGIEMHFWYFRISNISAIDPKTFPYLQQHFLFCVFPCLKALFVYISVKVVFYLFIFILFFVKFHLGYYLCNIRRKPTNSEAFILFFRRNR